MSLSRKEWEEMWKSVKYMETIARNMKEPRRKLFVTELNKMKEWIQEVIGQME